MNRLLFILLFISSICNAQDTISTIGGTGVMAYSGDNGPAISAELATPSKGVFDSVGNFYFVDNVNLIRKISNTGIISTIAGTLAPGFGGDGSLASLATFDQVADITIDKYGNLYLIDFLNNRVRKIDAVTGVITTIAGDGQNAFLGDGGPAALASIQASNSIAIGKNGDIYIGTTNRIRKIDAAGIITTICGDGTSGHTGDGGLAVNAITTGGYGMCVDTAGKIYFSEGAYIRVIDENGIINTIAGNGSISLNGDSMLATQTSIMAYDIDCDLSGKIYMADWYNSAVRVLDTDGYIYTIAGKPHTVPGYSGDGGPAIAAKINASGGITIDSCHNLWISDTQNDVIRKVTYHTCFPDVVTTVQNARSFTFTISPNPVTSDLTIAAGAKLNEVSVINVVGVLVHKAHCNSEKVTLDMRELPAGIYFVKMTDAHGASTVEKVVKQ